MIGAAQGQRLATRLEKLFAAALPEGFSLEIVDLLESPGVAERDNVIATPLLVRLSPGPKRYITGDLSDLERSARFLGEDFTKRNA